MNKFTLTFFFYCIIATALSNEKGNYYALSSEFINQINQKATTWKAGKNFDKNISWEQIQKLANGVLPTSPNDRLPAIFHSTEGVDIPDTFDARDQWPMCKSLKDIRDQGSCGSCWAFAAVECMSDRICIHSNYTLQPTISAQDLLGCCGGCQFGCSGGFPNFAWEYWQEAGVVTGGAYNTSEGCVAYQYIPCSHYINGTRPNCQDLITPIMPNCEKTCDDPTEDYKSSLTFGKSSYSIKNDVTQIQVEIIKNGPVEATYMVYDDFLTYKSGVYQNTSSSLVGKHAVKILGWGTENDTPYWLIANSWNSDWGDNGFFKIIRGVDNCGIEEDITAGLPKL